MALNTGQTSDGSLRAVLFDLDGTLFDRATSVAACVEAQHARFRHRLGDVPVEWYLARFLELDARGYVTKDVVYRRLAEELSLEPGLTGELFDDFYAHYHRHALPFPALESTLAALREGGLRLGLITNGGKAHQLATIDALGIRHWFDVILVSEAEGVRKPDPAIFLRALDRMGIAPTEAVFVGDHPEVDVAGARNAGLRAVWKRDSFWGDCPQAHATIDALDELPATLRALHAGNGYAF